MSERGICSRREADRFIERGQVRVDGKVILELGTKVAADVVVELLPQAKKRQAEKITIILNKPIGFVSTQPEKGYRPAIDLIVPRNQWKGKRFDHSFLRKLAVAGRLDIDAKGLLVLTQDGVIAKQLIGETSFLEKEFIVRVEGQITKDAINRLRFGLNLEGGPLKRAEVNQVEENLLCMVLHEGRKRQIHRMCEMVGLKVTGLKRVRIGGIRLGDLPDGHWRYLRKDEKF